MRITALVCLRAIRIDGLHANNLTITVCLYANEIVALGASSFDGIVYLRAICFASLCATWLEALHAIQLVVLRAIKVVLLRAI